VKLTDYIADFLNRKGVSHVFGLTGGAAAHLFQAIDDHPSLHPVFCHHEQAASFAAVGYARIRNGIGVCMVTTGPGGVNALTGLSAAWLDSIPCIFISGQVRLSHMGQGSKVRQVGVQHMNTIDIVKTITKYAVTIEDPKSIRYHLEKAAWFAQNGRPGPVWIEIPLDLQWASISPDNLREFEPSSKECNTALPRVQPAVIQQCVDLIREAKRPLILAGYGIRLGNAEDEFIEVVKKTGIPFIASWNASDIVRSEGKLNIGRPGIFGQRGANLAMQNCDLLICIGSHLSISLTGTMFEAFAREAKIVVVNIDRNELDHQTVRVDLPIHSDAKTFLESILTHPQLGNNDLADKWREKCALYKSKYNIIKTRDQDIKGRVDPYFFMSQLSEKLGSDDIIVIDGGGTVNQIGFQTLVTKRGQRLNISAGLCSMGSGLPESVGACFASGGRRVMCLCGDGSAQLNIQELQTIVHHQLPIKFFVLSNDGYVSIRATQKDFFDGKFLGSSSKGGLSMPDFVKIADAYGIKSLKIERQSELEEMVCLALETPGPCLVEIHTDPDATPEPRQGFDRHPDGTGTPRPLEDMFPYLPRSEFKEMMEIEPWGSAK